MKDGVYTCVYSGPEKYASSSPMDFIGLERFDKSETTPRLTSIFLMRPSHMSETSYYRVQFRVMEEKRKTHRASRYTCFNHPRDVSSQSRDITRWER